MGTLAAIMVSHLILFQAFCALVSSAPRPVLVLLLALSIKLFFFCQAASVRAAGQAVAKGIAIGVSFRVTIGYGSVGECTIAYNNEQRLTRNRRFADNHP